VSTISDWVMVALGVASLLLTVLVPVLVGLSRANKATARELSDHKTHVAETYSTKEDFKDLAARMERQMKNGFEQLEKLLTKREAQ